MRGGEAGQPQRYCKNCGTPIRPGNAYCVSCGAPLPPGTRRPGATHRAPESSRWAGYPTGGFGENLQGTTGRFGETFSGLHAEDLRHLPYPVRRWFGRLPFAGKVGLAGLLLLILLTFLSPVAAVVAGLAFCVSLVALVLRIGQRKSVARWGISAAVSLVLALAFSGASGVFYSGGGSTAETEMGARGGGSVAEDRGYGGAGSSRGGTEESGDASRETYANPTDVYLVSNDAFFMDGYLVVNRTSDGRFFHAFNLDHDHYASGEVLAGGRLYLHGDVGDLDYLEYVCTYDAADPRGGEAAMQKACGFSPLEE